ncbi:hypothetical protein PLA107_005695 [Pseudomonas amygdali pv. lachrymans str. M301315]|uniref:Uncharacterized protein n=1 Tax=Pseudomonas amygdali pv. lachrymans str. M301315 TaxID=629260 RepID=A0AAD0PV25_PSEAV|nr:hypothetical protein B5U27_05795 [Pseudomonas amygdali pv. lachrymans]AXH58991.1 hypothetical protein PLA107_005695 [Pseudomonas amygdali pv. lachrymans str. M301315]PWC99406.1 hypothetical protein CX658_28740 [Pseudomonas amygdali pv. lachrymans]
MPTEQEAAIARLLGEAWNAYLTLPVEHPMDQQEFCTAIHRCQDMVLARSGRRSLNADAACATNSDTAISWRGDST